MSDITNDSATSRPLVSNDSLSLQEYPLLPLKNTVLFPRTVVTLVVGRDKSVRAIDHAVGVERRLVVAAQKQVDLDDPDVADIFSIGTLVQINQVQRQADGNVQISVEGVRRVRIERYVNTREFFQVQVNRLLESHVAGPNLEALVRHVNSLFDRYSQLNPRVPTDAVGTIGTMRDPGRLSDLLAAHLISDLQTRQTLLETAEPMERLEKIGVFLQNEIEILELEDKLRQKVRQQVDRSQREYYLKEQLRAIQEELGGDRESEIEELRQKIEEKQLPAEVATKMQKDVMRLERMPPSSAEVVVLRNYLDWIVSLPWHEHTVDDAGIRRAKEVLDEDHYGLEKVKERIIEFLAVRQLTARQEGAKSKGPILCLVGPPGVGKTSLGRSIARSLGRKFVRMSLGGVRDEAEIRGHRKTYVGALPGRIIQGMKTVGVMNPVFLLDEVDKLARDYRGDPAAALLEVLDPEQNSTFVDHYLEAPYDLSDVFFIATANVIYHIPRPLLDRMEVIELPGYMEEEKIEIATRHLLPKVLREHGLTDGQLTVSDRAMRVIVSRYTREAGVRNLERSLATLCRKAARQVLDAENKKIRLTPGLLEDYLGPRIYQPDEALDRGLIGVATGLAFTEYGGALLPVEVATMPGKGGVIITGQLGDVMQESARAALSYARSRADEFGIDRTFQENTDLHIHLPEGAIPKDGPSAGITIALALISALTKRRIRHDVAMTGEITLRGRVLPIGGLKEKTLAAHRAGIRVLLIPSDNVRDLIDIPPKIRKQITFIPVSTMDEVVRHALLDGKPTPPIDEAAERELEA